jgi:hypothetical protein
VQVTARLGACPRRHQVCVWDHDRLGLGDSNGVKMTLEGAYPLLVVGQYVVSTSVQI